MNETAIKAVALSKRYSIGAPREKYKTLRDSIAGFFSHTNRSKSSSAPTTFWALRDASFEIAPGEVVGVIGRNGAGKSTLLKLLARITDPTDGYADVTGRVRSLLEVGTGFHQELSGRENIQLNGAILGMRKTEIAAKFDEIVAFAEVEQFIDTPVKRYSSGMYLRLAFAVAAHLESEILLVDEVLAVGDAAFQRKCLGKMGEVARAGRTVLFVSHNMAAVKELCGRAILLDGGRVAFEGAATECIGQYLRRVEAAPVQLETGARQIVIGQCRIAHPAGEGIRSGEPFRVSLSLAGRRAANPLLFFILEDFTGATIVHSRVGSRELGLDMIDGPAQLTLDFPALWLTPGVYSGYFKILLADAEDGAGRYLSERMIVEVTGEFGAFGKAALHPHVEWRVAESAATAPL